MQLKISCIYTHLQHISLIRVIVACCVLHNLAIDLKMPLDDNWDVDGDDFHQEENMPDLEIRPTGTITQKEAALRRLGNTKRDRVASKTFPR